MKNHFLILLVLSICIASCGDKKSTPSSQNEVYNADSDDTLGNDLISSLLKQHSFSDSIQAQVIKFYKNRNYQMAWVSDSSISHSVFDFQNQVQNFSYDFADTSLNNRTLDYLIELVKLDETHFFTQKLAVITLDVLLTATYFNYAQKAYGGINASVRNLEWYIPRHKKNFQSQLDSLLSENQSHVVKKPVNEYYNRLKKKLSMFRDIQKLGGFPAINTLDSTLSLGKKDSCLKALKMYLYLTNDLKLKDTSIYFNKTLAKALANFQTRMGLRRTGKLNQTTLLVLQKPVETWIEQIIVNMERLRWMPVKMEKDFILVNIPEFKLHVFEKSKHIWDSRIVVGKLATKTSVFKSNLSQVIFNPYWTIPTSIVKSELLAELKLDDGYLEEKEIEVLLGKTVMDPEKINWNDYDKEMPFTFRQKPGKDNALGKMMFMFPNHFSIYLHDTPAKVLFENAKRDFSHGCIRLAYPQKLAMYLLRKDSNWNEEKIDEVLETNEKTIVQLKTSIPVYIVYFTAWVTNDGLLHFRDDIYVLDSKLAKEYFAK